MRNKIFCKESESTGKTKAAKRTETRSRAFQKGNAPIFIFFMDTGLRSAISGSFGSGIFQDNH
jgi:hypothetical protein